MARSPRKQPARIRIDIDPVMPSGAIDGRRDICITGRVLSGQPLTTLTLSHSAEVVARLDFGHGVTPGAKAFRLNLPLPADAGAATLGLALDVAAVDGARRRRAFQIRVEDAVARPGYLVSAQPQDDAIETAGVHPGVALFVERAVLHSDGGLLAQGWAVAATGVDTVEVVVPGTEPIAGTPNLMRQDVAAAFPAVANAIVSGFELRGRLPPDPARRAVWVRALCPGGLVHETVVPLALATEPLFPPPEPPEPPEPEPEPPKPPILLYCDRASLRGDGLLRVGGWAYAAGGINRVEIDAGAFGTWRAELGIDRPDVAELFPDAPDAAKAGFRLARPGIDGTPDTVRIVAHDHTGETAELIVPLLPDAMPLPAGGVAGPSDSEFNFGLDFPSLLDGEVLEPITGRLTLEGWVLARSGVVSVEVLLDGHRLGEAHFGLTRQDVGAAFPDWPNAARSGFTFHCPPRSLRDGRHTMRLVVSAGNGLTLSQDFGFTVRRTEGLEQSTTIRRRISGAEAAVVAGLLADLHHAPVFRCLLLQGPVIDLDGLRRTLGALRDQVYDGWSLTVLADDDDAARAVRGAVVALDDDGSLARRVTVDTAGDALLGTPGSAELIGLLRPGDELGCDALAEFALAGAMHPAAAMLYADEARLSPASHEREPFFKPDYAPDLLLATNYIGRPWFVTAACLAATGTTARQLLARGEYDLVLRCAEVAAEVHHLPRLLCERGAGPLDDAAREAEALRQALDRQGTQGSVVPAAVPGTWRVRRAVSGPGKVSVIIPTCAAQGRIETCIRTLRERTAYRDLEIICVENIPASEKPWRDWVRRNADRTIHADGPFNWSWYNNRAAAVARGDYLLFLNDDIEVTQADWLDAMLEHAQRPEVGVVGPQLLYPEGRVQHAGMFLSENGIGRHAFRFSGADEPGYFGLALTQRNVIAVTGACMLMRRAVFDALGGFDEAHAIVNNDLDFCLRAHRAGLRTIYTPYASLVHHERTSRDRMPDSYDGARFDRAWRTTFAAGDPYFSPWLSLQADDYRPDDEPAQAVFTGPPRLRAADIHRILVLKLDHIGDFVTALPAIRELKQMFPRARLTALVNQSSRGLAAAEPAIDEVLEFGFFHARSQLGERELTEEDFATLAATLKPYRFDLAVDLRKQTDTRDVLRHTGARYLAGFDHQDRFPFLDVTVEWAGDHALHRKHAHVADDLLALVGAIAVACRTGGQLIQPPGGVVLPAALRPLFRKPVVVVHPGAGNITKQWPEEHYAALIDLLIERDGVNVVLIGGPEEAGLARELLAMSAHPAAIRSVAGTLPLEALPGLLAAAALFIGNDSGPKHIAAALGVPTIGVHSGVVDAEEWGPVGPRAVALRRNMSCAPCYLARARDCPRMLACLRHLEPAVVHRAARMFLARPASGVGTGPARPGPKRKTTTTGKARTT